MYDPETDSEWSHLLGQAMSGPMKGADLEQIPSAMTDWGSWKASHPDTTVLWMSPSSTEYRREFYRDPAKFVLGVVGDQEVAAWSFKDLVETSVFNDQLDANKVVVLFDPSSVTARLYSAEIKGQMLAFERNDEQIVDSQTGSVWDPVSGKCLEGAHKGERLQPLPGIVSYAKVWQRFHPQSKRHTP